jgi:hypothetical protein
VSTLTQGQLRRAVVAPGVKLVQERVGGLAARDPTNQLSRFDKCRNHKYAVLAILQSGKTVSCLIAQPIKVRIEYVQSEHMHSIWKRYWKMKGEGERAKTREKAINCLLHENDIYK